MATTETITDAVVLPPSRIMRPLVVAAVGAIAVGLLTRRRDLVRGGAQLGAVQLATLAIDAAVRRLDTHGDVIPAPPPMVAEAMATWLAETVVNAVFERLDPLAAAAIDHRPARLRPDRG